MILVLEQNENGKYVYRYMTEGETARIDRKRYSVSG